MKVLIIDDEPMPGKHLKDLIEEHCFEIEETNVIDSPLVALEHLKKHEYDLIFLDVEMPHFNGFELLKRVKLPVSTQVIFTTAYSQYALDAFKVNAAHYLLKMIKKEDLIEAVRKASHLIRKLDKQKKEDGIISIYSGDEHIIIKQEDIYRLEASGSYTKVIAKSGEYLSTKGLGSLEESLSKTCFCRCHNSHLINIKYVVKISKGKKGYITLENGDTIPLTTSKR